MNKKSIAGVAALALTLLVSGCAPSGSVSDPDNKTGVDTTDIRGSWLVEREVLLNDGRTVICIASSADANAGISCDWDGANTNDESY